MPALNYQKQFAPAVRFGEKLQTIRAKRRVPIIAGDKLFHFSGMRTANCERLGASTCTSVEPITITHAGEVFVDGKKLGPKAVADLAAADGSEFHGDLIKWKEITHA